MTRVEGFEVGQSGLQPVDDGGNPLAVGVWGDSDTAMGVFGTSGTVPPGVTPRGGDPAGVLGDSVQNPGVVGRSIDHMGVLGQSTNVFGVFGVSGSPTRGGVVGFNGAGGPAVSGFVEDTNAVEGSCFRRGVGVLGSNFRDRNDVPATGAGVSGFNEDTGAGVLGFSSRGDGVSGQTEMGFGVLGIVRGSGSGSGVVGVGITGDGVFGASQSVGVRGIGQSSQSTGVRGFSSEGTGVLGDSTNSTGVHGHSDIRAGVYGESYDGTGVMALSARGNGVFSLSGGSAVVGYTGSIGGAGAIEGHAAPNSGGFAGLFNGDVRVTGSLFKAGGGFEIDHPMDPGNKYLRHSYIESPDMLNIYTGMVTTDESGEAVVALPDYFETLNNISGYQLTVIGKPASAFVAEEVRNNRFTIRTSEPRVKVSWQVSGARRDPWAVAHPIIVEEEKSGSEQGRYLHAALWEQPEEVDMRGRPPWADQPDNSGQDSFQRAREMLPEQIQELLGRLPSTPDRDPGGREQREDTPTVLEQHVAAAAALAMDAESLEQHRREIADIMSRVPPSTP